MGFRKDWLCNGLPRALDFVEATGRAGSGADTMLMKYNKVIARDNVTRKEKIYENGG